MLETIDNTTKRLVVEAGIVAINHGLLKEAASILAALPYLISDQSARKTVAAILLLGLRRKADALAELEDEKTDEALALRCLIQGTSPAESATEGTAAALLLSRLAANQNNIKREKKLPTV